MKLEKTYTIPTDIFREGYREYQKKYVYTKNYIFMAIFLVLALNFVYGAVNAPDNFWAYIFIVICLAMAFREWYNPRKVRNSVMETVREMGEPVYKLIVTDEFLEFSTENAGVLESGEDDEDGENEMPEPTKLPMDSDLKILEYDRFFLAVYGKIMFYIIPKETFTEEEIETVRKINN